MPHREGGVDADGAWTAVEIDVDVAPMQEQLRLPRLDPTTGQGMVAELASLSEASEAWLVELATHELLLVTTNGETYQVTMLAGSEEGVLELGTIEGEGHVVAPPVVEHGVLAVGLERGDEEQAWIEPVAVPLEELG